MKRLDRIQIAKPCSEDWEAMPGDERLRLCTLCDKSVHNFSAMTSKEVERLLATTEGRLCARFERDADGAIITKTPPANAPLIRLRPSRLGSAAAATVLTLNLSAAASTQSAATQPAPAYARQEAKRANQPAQQPQSGATISGTVYDTTQAVIVNASVYLTNEATQAGRQTGTAEEGTFEIASLEPGSYSIRIEAAGFTKFQQSEIKLTSAQSIHLDITLQVGAMLGVIVEIPEKLMIEKIPAVLLTQIKRIMIRIKQ